MSSRTGSSSFYYDFDDYGSSDSSPYSPYSNPSQTKKKKAIFAAAATTLLLSLVAAFSVFQVDMSTLSELLMQRGGAAYLDPEQHKRASVMRLAPPYDRLRDVVWDLPVRESDVKVFWQTRETGSDVVVEMLSDCFKLTLATSTGKNYNNEHVSVCGWSLVARMIGIVLIDAFVLDTSVHLTCTSVKFFLFFSLCQTSCVDAKDVQVHKYNNKKYVNVDTTTLDGIKRAKDLDLVSSGLVDVIVSPHIRQVSDIFTEDNQGRIFAFFRHPIEREYARAKSGRIDDNWMTRLLINKTEGELNFVDLGMAKKVVREKCVVGLLDQHLYESIERIQKYYGWSGSEVCVEEYAKKLPYEQLGDRVEGDDEAWKLLHKHNVMDVQLYEFARSVFRAQKQTIVPLEKQIELAEGDA